RFARRAGAALGVAGLGLGFSLGWGGRAGADPEPWPSSVEPDVGEAPGSLESGDDAKGTSPAEPMRARAVAGPNVRLGVAYDYGRVDSTRTAFVDQNNLQTLELDAEDGQAVTGQLVGTVPLFSVVGLRATVRGGSREARRSLDALQPGSSDIDQYGGLAEILVRHPEIGSFAAGGGYDRLSGEGGASAEQIVGTATAQIFFPDLGTGPLDWFAQFEFRHRQVSGTGQTFDVDADVYDVSGGARWYLSPDVALVATGAWQRTEEEFFAEEDTTGGLALHWRLPLPIRPVSIELFAGGRAGISEYKEPPFRGDHRLVYGAHAGLTLRLFSGATLLESIRRYD
ncbi:hypothetical protein K2X89_12940, partial [Myxococcota bacterium]|nr:hypothetical protein [Myxococcota bacterium]